MNARNIFRITYKRPYNPYKSYPKNLVRGIATASTIGEEAAREKIAEITAKGFPIICIHNGCGEAVIF